MEVIDLNNNEISFLFKYINRESDKFIDEKLKKYNITHSQQAILGYLQHVDREYVIQKDIEKHFYISNPTVSGLLTRLEQKGFIERLPHPKDKRTKIIRLTSKAQELHQDIVNSIKQLDEFYRSILTVEEEKALLLILNKVAEKYKETEVIPC